MKLFNLRTVAQLIVQPLAMIFFMRVMNWDIFVSAGLAVLTAILAVLVVYWMQKRLAAGKKDA